VPTDQEEPVIDSIKHPIAATTVKKFGVSLEDLCGMIYADYWKHCNPF
jgi:hypothetical protein